MARTLALGHGNRFGIRLLSAFYTKKFNIVKQVFVHRVNEMTVYILEVVGINVNSPERKCTDLRV